MTPGSGNNEDHATPLPALAPARVRIKDIAKRLGLATSTVSMAIQNNPKIAAATRDRVQATADAMGYRSDPVLRKLMSHLHCGRTRSFQSTVYIICDHAARLLRPTINKTVTALSAKLEALGYMMEITDYPTTSTGADRLVRTLRARRVEGVVLMPQLRHEIERNLYDYLQKLAIISMLSCTVPGADTVKFNWHQSITLTLKHVSCRHRRKIGFIYCTHLNELTDGSIMAAVLNFQHGAANAAVSTFALPPFSPSEPRRGRFSNGPETPPPSQRLRDWFRLEEPEALVILPYDDVEGVLKVLELSSPPPVSIYAIGMDADSPYSGCVNDINQLVQLGAEWLDTKIRTGKHGVFDTDTQTSISGTWLTRGKTVKETAPVHSDRIPRTTLEPSVSQS